MTAHIPIGVHLDPHGVDIIIRVRVQSKPGATTVPSIHVTTPDDDGAEVMAIAFIDDEALAKAWSAFRRRATAWNPIRSPIDFVKFDLFGQSIVADRVLERGEATPTAQAIRSGGMSLEEITAVLEDAGVIQRREPAP